MEDTQTKEDREREVFRDAYLCAKRLAYPTISVPTLTILVEKECPDLDPATAYAAAWVVCGGNQRFRSFS